MKDRMILILLVATVGIATFWHSAKNKPAGNIDKIAEKLSAAKALIPTEQHISFKYDPSKLESYLWARYIMAPRHLDISGKYDTILAIQPLNYSDSTVTALPAIWQASDDQYHYSLTISN